MKIFSLKRIIVVLLTIYAVFCRSGEGRAYEIVIAQTSPASYYEKAVAGFMEVAVESVAITGPKSASPDTVNRFYINDTRDRELMARQISGSKPDLILAVGNQALEETEKYSDIPIVHLLVPSAAKYRAARSNVTGIEMMVAPARQLAAFIEVLPSVKSIGVVYDSAHSASFVKEAQAIADMRGIALVAEEVQDPRDVPALLTRFVGLVDAFWMLPDPTVTTPVTVEAMLNFSFENDVPLLTFSDKYLKVGASVSAGFDLFEIGSQAGRLARKLLASPTGKFVEAEYPEAVKVELNHKMVAKLGLLVNTASLNDRTFLD